MRCLMNASQARVPSIAKFRPRTVNLKGGEHLQAVTQLDRGKLRLVIEEKKGRGPILLILARLGVC